MESKLTDNDLARVFARYIGCEIAYPDTSGSAKLKIKAMLTKVGFDEIETTYKRKKSGCVGDIISFKENKHHKCSAQYCQLILKPVSEISDDHVLMVAELCGVLPQTINRGTDAIKVANGVYEMHLGYGVIAAFVRMGNYTMQKLYALMTSCEN